MPLTLLVYIGRELLKLLALSTAALTVLISVAFMVQPMSEGSLDVLSTARLVVYLMPPMLPYALLIGATLAGTLVYHRLAQDNELTACAMSGMSYRTLLLPGLVLGLALTLGLFYFSNWIVPGFWQRVEQLVKRDAARLFVDRLNTEGVVRFRSVMVYADAAWIQPAPDRRDTPATLEQRIVLDRVAVAKFDERSGALEFDVTGRRAVADLHRYRGRTYAQVKVSDASLMDAGTGALIRVDEHTLPPQRVPSLFEQKPKFLSLSRLREVVRRPELDPQVHERADALRVAMAELRAVDWLHGRLLRSGDEPIELAGPEGRLHTLSAPMTQPAGRKLRLLSEPGQPIRVRIGPRPAPWQTLEAGGGMLEAALDHADAEPRVLIELRDVSVSGQNLPRQTRKRELTLPRLSLPERHAAPLRALGPRPLIREAGRVDDGRIASLGRRLADRIAALQHEILLTANERAAGAVSLVMMMLLGGLMAMANRGKQPLVIFFWSFLPAIVAMFLIAGARNLIQAGAFGLGPWFNAAAVWAGNVLLLALILTTYLKLARH